MIKQNKISISGLAGSGKSTVGKLVAQKLNYDFVSVGNYSRQLALDEFGMSINQFQEYCKNNPEMDKKIDRYFIDYCESKSNLIIDYRLAFHFLNDCYHAFLNVSDDIAVKRITQSNNRELELDGCNDIHRLIKARNENMRLRFEQTYNVDFTNLNNYQLVINTDNFSPEEVVKIITKNFEQCTSLK